mgnify:CR=1 FL=1
MKSSTSEFHTIRGLTSHVRLWGPVDAPKLFLLHGMMDDNVPPYNTQLVAQALMNANKDFDQIMLPDARHGYGKDTPYIMRRRWDYFVKHLLGVEPPPQFELKPAM